MLLGKLVNCQRGAVSLDAQITVTAFLQPTLVCESSACLADVLALLAQRENQEQDAIVSPDEADFPISNRDHLILVDEHQHPLGLVPLSLLLGDTLLAAESVSEPFQPLPSFRPLLEMAAAYLEPLLCVPAHISLFQFWQQLQSIPPTTAHWAIIAETSGAFLGLVDLPKLVYCLAHQSTLSPAMPWLVDVKSQLDASLRFQSGSTAAALETVLDLAQPLQAKIANLTVHNQLNSVLLAEVSHELKTPLTAIVGLSHVLKNSSLGLLSDRQRQYVELISQKSQQLMRLVSELLDFTQLQTHPLTLRPEPVALETLCKQAIAQATHAYEQEQARSHTQPIQLTLAPVLPPLVADELRLRQMLVALLRNGLGLAGAQGAVGLQVESWGNWITFTIWDTGLSIPPHQQHLVCQIPQTIDHPERDQLYAMGLGVILAQRLAHQQGGDLTFVSAPDQGNQFTLLLPSQPPTVIPQTSQCRSTQGSVILIVAAAPDLISMLTQQFRARGDQAVIARSGPEAIEKTRILQPRLIVLHLILPLVSGWDVLTLLQGSPETAGVPIIAIGENHQHQIALHKGAQAFLTMPILRQDLDHCLDQVGGDLESKAAIAPDSHTNWGTGQTDVQHTNTALNPGLASMPNPAPEPSLAHLTVLHLECPSPPGGELENLTATVRRPLQVCGCRVVATDDLEEAELLAQIWSPKVILYSGQAPTPLHQLSHHPPLAVLPLVLVHPQLADLGHQLPRLTIFACPLSTAASATDITSFLQVLKVAASVNG
jgi:signal transduction histidine kinase/ActR/RegA family two-component response regulator